MHTAIEGPRAGDFMCALPQPEVVQCRVKSFDESVQEQVAKADALVHVPKCCRGDVVELSEAQKGCREPG